MSYSLAITNGYEGSPALGLDSLGLLRVLPFALTTRDRERGSEKAYEWPLGV